MDNNAKIVEDYLNWLEGINPLSDEDKQAFADDFWAVTERRIKLEEDDDIYDGFEILSLDGRTR